MTADNIIARMTRVHNQLIAASRATKYIYDDLPLVRMNPFDSDLLEAFDAIMAAAEKVFTIRAEMRKEKIS